MGDPSPYEMWAPEEHFAPLLSIDVPNVKTLMFFVFSTKN